MAFKIKHPFKFHDTTNNQRTLGRDGRVVSPVKQTDPRDPNYVSPEASRLSKLDPRDLTLDDVVNLPRPVTKADYNLRHKIRPKFAENPDAGMEEKLMNFVYDNPWALSAAMKTPVINNIVKDNIKKYMGRSQGGAGTTLDDYNKYVSKIEENNAEELAIQKENPSYEPQIDEILSKEDYYDQYKGDIGYKGEGYFGDIHWRGKDAAQPVDQYLSDKPLYKEATNAPKSDFYPFMKRYSVKGDDFAKNLDQVNPDLASDFIYEDLAGLGPWEKPGWDDMSEEEQLAAENKFQQEVDKKSQLTNRQMVPYLLDKIMMQTKDFSGGDEEEEIDLPYFTKDSDAWRGRDYGVYGGEKANPIVDKAFEQLYSGNYQSPYSNTSGIMVGRNEEDGLISSFMNTDYGRVRAGFGMDDKLPYASISDAWDFQATGPGGYGQNWDAGDVAVNEDGEIMGDIGTEFKQAQLLQQAGELAGGGGFKLYDRFYFHPSKSGKRDLIEDKNIPFAQEFYGSNKYSDEETMRENNPDWIQPELLDEVVINVSKKDIEEKEKKSPGSTRFEVLKNRQ